jgi:hypothetical protein
MEIIMQEIIDSLSDIIGEMFPLMELLLTKQMSSSNIWLSSLLYNKEFV